MIERYLTAHELAETMGVSVSTVRRFTQRGMPSETWGMGRMRRYRASECIAWAKEREATLTDDNQPRRDFTVVTRRD